MLSIWIFNCLLDVLGRVIPWLAAITAAQFRSGQKNTCFHFQKARCAFWKKTRWMVNVWIGFFEHTNRALPSTKPPHAGADSTSSKVGWTNGWTDGTNTKSYCDVIFIHQVWLVHQCFYTLRNWKHCQTYTLKKGNAKDSSPETLSHQGPHPYSRFFFKKWVISDLSLMIDFLKHSSLSYDRFCCLTMLCCEPNWLSLQVLWRLPLCRCSGRGATLPWGGWETEKNHILCIQNVWNEQHQKWEKTSWSENAHMLWFGWKLASEKKQT